VLIVLQILALLVWGVNTRSRSLEELAPEAVDEAGGSANGAANRATTPLQDAR